MNQRASYQPSGRTEVARLRRQLDELFVRVDDVDQAAEIAGDLHRYLCVRVSGFLEQALTSCAKACAAQGARGSALNFAHSWLDRSPNPRSAEVVRMVGRFESDWATELEAFLKDDERWSQLNSLLGLRNDIAHGKNQGVGRKQAWAYYKVVNEVVDWIMDRFDPMP